MTGDPAVQTTVVVPVWDAYVSARLNEALASLAEQDRAARIVVVDNASEVELPELPAISVVRSPRRLALGPARNLGLAQVTTPFVVVWDADDVMLPGTLGFLESEIRSDPRLAAFATAIVEDPPGVRHRWPRRWISRLVHFRRLFALLDCVWALYPTTGATIMRTDVVLAGGGYSEAESGDDWVAGVSLAFRGRVGWSERPGRLYRRHRHSVWARHSSAGHLVTHACAVRDRIRTDPGIPRWVKLLLPLIQLGQYVAVAAHVAVSVARGGRCGTRR